MQCGSGSSGGTPPSSLWVSLDKTAFLKLPTKGRPKVEKLLGKGFLKKGDGKGSEVCDQLWIFF